MAVDKERIEEAVLALLWQTLHDGRWAWKGCKRCLEPLFFKCAGDG
jgi:hypothetical protein